MLGGLHPPEAALQEIIFFNGSYQQNYQQFVNMKIEPSEDRIIYHELSDNRDLSVMMRWDPLFTPENENFYEKVEDMERENFNQDVELLQIRSNLLRITAASIDLIHMPNGPPINEQNGHDTVSVDENYKLLSKCWRELFDRVRKLNYKRPSSQFLVNLLPSRLHYMIELPYEETITALSDFVYNLWMGNDKAKKSAKVLQDAFIGVKNFIEELKAVDVESKIFDYRNFQASLVGCVEVCVRFIC